MQWILATTFPIQFALHSSHKIFKWKPLFRSNHSFRFLFVSLKIFESLWFSEIYLQTVHTVENCKIFWHTVLSQVIQSRSCNCVYVFRPFIIVIQYIFCKEDAYIPKKLCIYRPYITKPRLLVSWNTQLNCKISLHMDDSGRSAVLGATSTVFISSSFLNYQKICAG